MVPNRKYRNFGNFSSVWSCTAIIKWCLLVLGQIQFAGSEFWIFGGFGWVCSSILVGKPRFERVWSSASMVQSSSKFVISEFNPTLTIIKSFQNMWSVLLEPTILQDYLVLGDQSSTSTVPWTTFFLQRILSPICSSQKQIIQYKMKFLGKLQDQIQYKYVPNIPSSSKVFFSSWKR